LRIIYAATYDEEKSWLSVGALQVVLFVNNTSSQSRVRYQSPDTKKQKAQDFHS
jgi:hypothetical protein